MKLGVEQELHSLPWTAGRLGRARNTTVARPLNGDGAGRSTSWRRGLEYGTLPSGVAFESIIARGRPQP